MTESQKKERIYRTAFPDQPLHELEDEVWKPVVVHGHVVEGYHVSSYGNVIGPQGKKLKWIERAGYPSVTVMVDKEFAGYTYESSNTSANRKRLNVCVHTLVANAFLPLSNTDVLPDSLNRQVTIGKTTFNFWDICPDDIKEFIRSCLNVDHIDANKSNSHVNNLRYVSPRENNHYIKKSTVNNESSN